MVVHREPKLCKVRPKWLEESGPLNVEQRELKVCGKKSDTSLQASELSVSYEKRPILTNVAYSVVFGKSPPFFVFGGPF
jgi:hypothetical protein